MFNSKTQKKNVNNLGAWGVQYIVFVLTDWQKKHWEFKSILCVMKTIRMQFVVPYDSSYESKSSDCMGFYIYI